jgi:hypothetical protein
MSKILEAELFEEIVFHDDHFFVKKICFWEKSSLHIDKESGYFKVLLPGGKSFNVGCVGTYAFGDGKRATNNTYHYIGDFYNGLAKIIIPDQGYGFINKNFELIGSAKYNFASNFSNGYSVVTIIENNNKKIYFIDNNGKEHFFEKDYSVVNDNSEDTFRVSTMDFGGFWSFMGVFAYFSDYSDNAGIWGYTDNLGKEIIPPQYIYAFDFNKGLALVAKGKWERKKEWNNKYWSNEELWGMIDKKGNEVIPCKFDEIKYFLYYGNDKEEDDSNYLMAHFGGWENGKWGIIDYNGNWVVDPIFEDLGYDIYNDDLVTFYKDDKWSNPDNVPKGIYSIKNKKVIFKPQFMDVDFLNDDTIIIERYNKKFKQNIVSIINLAGKKIFPSIYNSLWQISDGKYYQVSINDENGNRLYGVIDKSGIILLPCKEKIDYNGILFSEKKIIFKDGEKCGVKDFSGNIIIPANYTQIVNFENKYFLIKIGGGKSGIIDEGLWGLMTHENKIIIPIIYNTISKENDIIICINNEGTTLYKIITIEKNE